MTRHRIIPPIYFLAALLAAVGLHFYFPVWRVVPSPFNLSGGALIIVGLALVVWAAGLFRAARTPVRPFERSTSVVTSGPYRFSRNPMYLGMVLVLVGVAVLFGSLAAFVPIPLFVWQIRRKFVLPEEAFLEELFGNPYVQYKARVRRWL
jgi:protein-S-isoprenylcysteine O-methyltransferase Ste14